MRKKYINKLIEQQEVVKILRKNTGGDRHITGIILACSSNFLLIQAINYLQFNGYVILRRGQYQEIRCSKYEKSIRRVLEGEGSLPNKYGLEFDLNLKSIKTIIQSIMPHYEFITFDAEIERIFYIGKPVEVKGKSVKVQFFDGAGVLRKDIRKINYKDITLLEFGDVYTETFKKYLVLEQ